MGYAFCMGICYTCERVFSFNPVKVPSIRIEGTRQPVCEDCVRAANPKRIANGLPAIEYSPDAYQPCEEGELP